MTPSECEACETAMLEETTAELHAHAMDLHTLLAEKDARIRELVGDHLRLAKHHFGDHSEECDECGIEEPSVEAIRILQPLGIVSDSGSTLHGKKFEAALARSEGDGA